MTEAEYEYECSRAELLGIEKPSREEFFSRQRENADQSRVDESEDLETEQAEVLNEQGENLKKVGGGLEELNNILSITQKKINHLKTVCGSFTSILKLQSSSSKSDGSNENIENPAESKTLEANESSAETGAVKEGTGTGTKKPPQTDMQSAVDSQVDKLDALIMKAEKAELSMSSQNKQMKSFLK